VSTILSSPSCAPEAWTAIHKNFENIFQLLIITASADSFPITKEMNAQTIFDNQ
jgi:hypothetical protein